MELLLAQCELYLLWNILKISEKKWLQNTNTQNGLIFINPQKSSSYWNELFLIVAVNWPAQWSILEHSNALYPWNWPTKKLYSIFRVFEPIASLPLLLRHRGNAVHSVLLTLNLLGISDCKWIGTFCKSKFFQMWCLKIENFCSTGKTSYF